MNRAGEIEALIRDASRDGVTALSLGSGHVRLRAPDGRTATVSRHHATDGAIKRAKSKIARLRRPDSGKSGVLRLGGRYERSED